MKRRYAKKPLFEGWVQFYGGRIFDVAEVVIVKGARPPMESKKVAVFEVLPDRAYPKKKK